jgi:SET domain-containing protein
VWLDKKSIEAAPETVKTLYEDFAIIRGEKYGCRQSFNALTVWYINHSTEPNVACDSDYSFYALRDIDPDEELTADYRTYSDLPKHMTALSDTKS